MTFHQNILKFEFEICVSESFFSPASCITKDKYQQRLKSNLLRVYSLCVEIRQKVQHNVIELLAAHTLVWNFFNILSDRRIMSIYKNIWDFFSLCRNVKSLHFLDVIEIWIIKDILKQTYFAINKSPMLLMIQ